MEGLKKLEQVQKTILFMESRGLLLSADDSNRFLANLILLLIQPCGELDTGMKCQLISDNLPKISAAFLNEASLWLGDEGTANLESKHVGTFAEGNEQIENTVPLQCDHKANFGSLESETEDMAMIGLDAVQRANSTLEDFCRSYFMFHEMDANEPQSLFRYLPLLSFTESYIYQMDSLNEKLLQLPTTGVPVLDKGFDVETNRIWILKFVELLRTDPFRPLVLLLERRGLLTDRLREEFKCGEEYWTLERKLCCALTSKKEISIEDVMRAIHLKSFDYRVLNYLLYQLRGEKVNEMHMEFLSISEFLVEISDDLFDYEDDVLENNFNILRMFVRIYGASAAPAMLAKSITEAEEKYNSLLKALDPKLSINYHKRCEEATKEGGKTLGPPLGTWSIPPVIEDEKLYQSEILKNTKPLDNGDVDYTDFYGGAMVVAMLVQNGGGGCAVAAVLPLQFYSGGGLVEPLLPEALEL
ncbi:hypothetical protein LguiA_013662 [Lonicera macranthoides]